MRALPVITALWLLPCTLFAQTNISGVVNSYHKVTGINYTESGLKLDNVSGIAANDRVMIIQMKGATVNTTVNSNSFGSITSLNGAGNYEFATVCSVRNDSVFLIQQLLRTYSVTNKVQLVKIPRYTSATVIGTLEAAVWDSASGKGGVLAIIVSETLSLNAPVSASAKGFRGGMFYKDGGGCGSNAFQNYAYDPTPSTYSFYTNVQRGAWKGESVADLALSMDGGRGACANGGGGGNNHNNGGGGGSNLAAAGKGGDNLSTTGCTGQHAGIGGYALNSNGGAKIFFGGGGGAGHVNNTTTSSGGGYGGGIVFIQAGLLATNGFTISANGSAGGGTSGDGASGGGGGGTILLAVNNYIGAVSLEAMGGSGGSVDDEAISGRCYGEGGGGSGGIIYFTGAQPAGTVDAGGGAKGVKLGSTCASNTGMNGSAGSLVINYAIVESPTASGCVGAMLDTELRYFRIGTTANSVVMRWGVTDAANTLFIVERQTNGNWMQLASIPSGDNKLEYSYSDPNPGPGTHGYRLKLVSSQRAIYSSIQQVTINRRGQTISYVPSTQQVFVRGGIDKEETIRIFDHSGRCIYQKKFMSACSEWQKDCSFLRRGVYIVKTGKAVAKFIVVTQ
jgi:hypothetical protein